VGHCAHDFCLIALRRTIAIPSAAAPCSPDLAFTT
jgi:hypothetical protein